MWKTTKPLLIVVISTTLTACVATQTPSTASANNTTVAAPKTVTPVQSVENATGAITLEQIMSDPDWLGRQPTSPEWSLDGESIVYKRKREGSVIEDYFVAKPGILNNGEAVALRELHTVERERQVSNSDKSLTAWVFEDNIYVYKHDTQTVVQVTRDSDVPRDLLFMNDGRLAYRVDNRYVAVSLQNGFSEELVHWQYANEPEAVSEAKDFIAREQIKLIDYIANKRADRQTRADYTDELKAQNNTVTNNRFYLPKSHENVAVALSPNGQYLIVASREDLPTRSDGDIMPNYIQEDGRIAADRVRQRVADTKPESHSLWLLNLQTHKMTELEKHVLPGYNDDVLAEVKRENAEAIGEDYQVNRLPRDIGLLQSWYGLSPIVWHSNGNQVAIMLEAWDNKDRWITTVDFDKAQLETQHRLSDEAWINYAYNQFGWLNQSETLYFLSEESGYSHLYVKPIDGDAKALTSGNYVVDNVTLSDDDAFAYFTANVKHPGIYEVYRVPLNGGDKVALTDLNGMTDYVLSPDETSLLLTHSKLTMPPELYTLALQKASASPVKVTDTVSDAFLALPWVAPSIVPVQSSHDDAPIYSRVYLPTNESSEKRKAVIFNHGAGYLQNSHMGWSGYFREFMFHSMLAHEGYVVMDMDYRASKGYGRDWRTAIYRRMGTPEIEDLVDGVKWLVENANVDESRIGTYGGSYGGFMTFMALFTKPELFQAGAALRPVSDWAHYNHPYTSNILNTPDVDPIAYRRSSPIYFAEGLEKPLLINAPMVDNNVFFVDVVRLVQRLIELEKENFETAIYPVEPHGFVQPSSWLDEYRRIYKLFDENL
ncbi:S9 family peptidase [Alteromonas facilis]|uniref:S9 family peptidase n=1 Tax=Alteromonas facilis TaxID=2048004 RepID=UPI000C28C4FB|nr:prolyl oligopeptidase family serine peptidase [Alteromonas facilis]